MSHYTKLTDARDLLSIIASDERVRTTINGHGFVGYLEAAIERLEDVIDDLEPTDEEQGLISIPKGYAEQ